MSAEPPALTGPEFTGKDSLRREVLLNSTIVAMRGPPKHEAPFVHAAPPVMRLVNHPVMTPYKNGCGEDALRPLESAHASITGAEH